MGGRHYDTVSFLSDYGWRDEFVGVVKSVVRDLAPHATVIDLTHEIEPFDVRAGSLALARCVPYVVSGVVLAVVDPGVGTARQAIAVEVSGGAGVFVGPDNGLLGPAVAIAGGAERAVALTNPELQLAAPGATFAGRDVFGPAAAHLCNGVDLLELGDPLDVDVLTPGLVPLPREEQGALLCEVLWVDRFGNCQLNISPDDLDDLDDLDDVVGITVGSDLPRRAARRCTTFADIPPGGLGLVLDSYGLFALAMDRRSAAVELGLAPASQVIVSRIDAAGEAGAGTTSPIVLGPRR
jgi:S-adenosylmethionine hydrolase